ncbi:hypothetical protein G7Y79_00085g101090 [Physcia stellaris]|nr:hypothetical protein G7Y79_00085g101090 [Physcia stellaris]
MTSIPPLPSKFGPFDPPRDIDLFNPSLSCPDSETRQFNDVTSFLRNLEHCQGLYRYRRTKLLEYMLWALNDPAWEWFKKQSHFNSLPRFDMALTKAFPSQEQRELKSIAQKRAKRKARKATKRTELEIIETAKKTPKLQDIGTFDPSACNEPEFGQYSEATDFLQHLEQCQHLYRKSDLLNLLPKCLCDSAAEWLKLQSEFTSLKRFNKALTKAFPPAEISSRRAPSRSSNLQLSTLDVISESIENLSDYEATRARVICKLCKQSFNSNRELYEHIRNHEALKPAKDSHLSINAANLVCETKEKPSATHVSPASFREQHAKRPAVSSHFLIDAAKSACESMKISTTNSSPSASLVVQSEQVSELSTLSELPLPAPLGTFNPARPHQDPEKRRFNQAAAFIQHLQQCQHLYGESELLEWMEVILCGPADTWFGNQPDFTSLHDFSIALTKAFPTSTSSTMVSSPLSSPAAESTCETAKRSATCRHCKQTFKFKELLRKHKREQHAKTPAISSSLRSHAPKPVYKAEKKSAAKDVTTLSASRELQTPAQQPQKIIVQKPPVISSSLSTTTANPTCKVAEKSATTSTAEASELTPEQKAEWRSRTAYLSTRLKASRLDLSLNTFITIPERAENASIQEVTCVRARCRQCKQDFDSNKELFEHISQHEALRPVKSSSLSVNTAKSTCEAVEKPAIACPPLSQKSSTPSATPKSIFYPTLIPEPVSSKGSHLPIATPKITSERVEDALIQQGACARVCKRCKQSFNFNNKLHEHIREHHARKPVRSLNPRASASEHTYKIIEKSASICPPALLAPQEPPLPLQHHEVKHPTLQQPPDRYHQFA